MVGDCSSFRPSSCINAARCRDVVQYPHLYSPWNHNVFHVQCTTTQHSSTAFPMSNVLAHTTAHNHSYTDSSTYYLVTMCSLCTFLLAQMSRCYSLSLSLSPCCPSCVVPSPLQLTENGLAPGPWTSTLILRAPAIALSGAQLFVTHASYHNWHSKWSFSGWLPRQHYLQSRQVHFSMLKLGSAFAKCSGHPTRNCLARAHHVHAYMYTFISQLIRMVAGVITGYYGSIVRCREL